MRVARSLSVHPVPATRLGNAGPTAAALPEYYCLAPCRPLPAFDPIPSVKRVLFSRTVVKSYDACFRSTRVLLVPLYCVGLVLRLASFFVSEPAINPLAVTAAACLTPLCFIAFLDMRTKLILVLLKSFDFWFLSATSLLWMVSLGAAMGSSMRLAVLPALWMEMIIGILTESLVIVRSGFSVVSVSVLVSILAIMIGVSLNLTSGLDYYETIFTIAPTHFVLSLRDVILNTMGTITIFYARLMFFSIPATTTYASVFFACCQRKLLRFVVTTFNFIFLSAQLSVAHMCVCDVFYWQTHKMISVVSSWLWIHVLLTADALTPAMKSHLGFKVWHLLPVIVLAIAGQVALVVDLVWTSRWNLQERVVWSVDVHRDHRVEFHSSSVLLGRLATLVVWFLRLLRRVCYRSSDDELILLQGGAEFDYISWKRLASQAPRATGVAFTQRY